MFGLEVKVVSSLLFSHQTKGPGAKILPTVVEAADKVTEKEFVEFCEGQTDSMLHHYINKDDRVKKLSRKKQSSRNSLMGGKVGGGGDLSRQLSLNPPRYENTYQLEPTPEQNKFYTEKVSRIIKSVLEKYLADVEYDYATFSKLTTELSDRIKEKVKEELELPRHKVVSFVSVGQMKDQGVRVGSRCVWNPAWDHFASASYQTKSVFAVGVVYATYFE